MSLPARIYPRMPRLKPPHEEGPLLHLLPHLLMHPRIHPRTLPPFPRASINGVNAQSYQTSMRALEGQTGSAKATGWRSPTMNVNGSMSCAAKPISRSMTDTQDDLIVTRRLCKGDIPLTRKHWLGWKPPHSNGASLNGSKSSPRIQHTHRTVLPRW